MPGTQSVIHSISDHLLHIEADTVRVPSVPTQPLTSALGKDVYFLPDASPCPRAQAGKARQAALTKDTQELRLSCPVGGNGPEVRGVPSPAFPSGLSPSCAQWQLP